MDHRDEQDRFLGCEIRSLKAIGPWRQLSHTDKAVVLGSVGVDSGSVQIGDFISGCGGRIISSPDGDGAYALYAKLIDGRRCLVVDFDAHTDGERVWQSKEETRGEWKCPICGAPEQSGGYSESGQEIECTNGHVTEYAHDEISAGFEKLDPEKNTEEVDDGKA